jgi:type IV secretion system protein VirB6
MSSTPGPFILFTTIWNILVPPIQSGETAIIAALQAYVTTWFALAVGVYLMAILLMAALNPSEADATLLFRKAFLAGVVWSLAATTAGFSTYITGFTNGAVTSVSTSIAGAFGGTPITSAGAFDSLATQMIAVGGVAMKHVPWYEIVRGLGTFLICDFFILAALIMIFVMFLVFMLSSIMLGFLSAFGPLFVACYLFPMSRRFFDGWLGTVVTAMVMQVFVVGITTLLSLVVASIIQPIMTTMKSGDAAPGGDLFTQLVAVITLLMTVAVFLFLTVYLARLAMSIGGGAHAQFVKLPGRRPPGGGGSSGGGGSGAGSGGGSSGGGGGGAGVAAAGVGAAQRSYAFTRTVGGAS